MAVQMIIHRGSHQIGGCCTEFRSERAHTFIDFGTELPEPGGEQKPDTLSISGLTEGVPGSAGVFFTHYHGDHIGNIGRILPEIPLFMGQASHQIFLTLTQRLQRAYERGAEDIGDHSAVIAALERVTVLRPAVPVSIGDIRITPFRTDHSAFDAYMFLIEADGVRVLHTGDFRDHGFTGKALVTLLEKYVGTVDWLVMEGTLLSRRGSAVITEAELQKQAKKAIAENKNVFVMCSSTNIDRLAAIYHAKPSDRPGVCDAYQKQILDVVQQFDRSRSGAYQFKYVIPYDDKNHKLLSWMEEKGFVMFVRDNQFFRKIMDRYRGNCKVIYSMWEGYLDDPQTSSFLDGYDFIQLHTSGHATEKALKAVYDTVSPKGVIPIHTEHPERYGEVLGCSSIIRLSDGCPLYLT